MGDTIRFGISIDDTLQREISGEVDWHYVFRCLDPGAPLAVV